MSSILRENYKYMVFRFDKEEKTFYSLGVSRKLQDGSYEKGYLPVQFKKGVNIPNQTLIIVKSEWETFYKAGQTTNFYHFINDFEIVKKDENAPYQKMREQLDTDAELPF